MIANYVAFYLVFTLFFVSVLAVQLVPENRWGELPVRILLWPVFVAIWLLKAAMHGFWIVEILSVVSCAVRYVFRLIRRDYVKAERSAEEYK